MISRSYKSIKQLNGGVKNNREHVCRLHSFTHWSSSAASALRSRFLQPNFY